MRALTRELRFLHVQHTCTVAMLRESCAKATRGTCHHSNKVDRHTILTRRLHAPDQQCHDIHIACECDGCGNDGTCCYAAGMHAQ